MKTTIKVAAAVLIVIALSISNGIAGEPKLSGFLGDAAVYKQLGPGPEGGAKMRWLKPGADFSKYNKIMLDSVIFYLADNSDKGIDPQDMKELADVFNLELVTALKDKYQIVGDPGPGVARIRIAITNIKPSKPGISAVSSVMPIGLGISLLKRGATGGWSGGGEVGIELIAIDTASNDVIALAADDKQAAFEQRFSKMGAAKDAFKFWADRIRMFLDEASQKKPN